MHTASSRSILLAIVLAVAGCHIEVEPVDDPVDGGVRTDDAGVALVDACPDDVCDEGCADELHGLCLPARIDADTPFEVTTQNNDCVGSTCTLVFASVCTTRVVENRVEVDGNVCAQHDDNTSSCSEDCGGRSGGSCTLPGLAAGTWTIAVGAQERTITVPFVRDPGTAECL